MKPALLPLAAALLFLAACKKDEGAAPASSAVKSAPLATSAEAKPPSAHGAGAKRPSDVIPVAGGGELRVTPIHHATLLLETEGRALYFDPVHDASYEGLPKAHIIFITDIHGDHLDPAGIQAVRGPLTLIVAPPAVAEKLPKDLGRVEVLKNGDKKTIATDADNSWGVEVEAVPMYNLVRGPDAGLLFHDKGRGDGYVLKIDGKRVYVAGDTECTPEMKALKDIDVAFVPMNLPYTMPPSEAAECVNAFKPKIVYPYHYRQSNLEEFTKAISKASGVEVRLRDWYAK